MKKQQQIILSNSDFALIIDPISKGWVISLLNRKSHVFKKVKGLGPSISYSEARQLLSALSDGMSLDKALAEVIGAA